MTCVGMELAELSDQEETQMFGTIEKLVELAEHMKLRVFFKQTRHIGSHHPATGIIEINQNLHPKAQIAVLAHELGHVLSGINVPLGEKIVSAMQGKATEIVMHCETAAWEAADKLAKTFKFDDEFYFQVRMLSLNSYSKEVSPCMFS